MRKHTLDSNDNICQIYQMIKHDEAMFYFHNEEEDGEESSGSSNEDEIDEGIPIYYDVQN